MLCGVFFYEMYSYRTTIASISDPKSPLEVSLEWNQQISLEGKRSQNFVQVD